MTLVDWGWVGDHLDDIASRTLEHLLLTGLAVGIGFVVSLGLVAIGVWRPRLAFPIAAGAGVLYTIPSLALFAFFIPFTGIGLVTAEIALVSYTILTLVRTISAGLAGIPPAVREAADAMGYRGPGRFLRVELPLATPSVVAGLRVATVSTVGLVTVTSLLGLGGLGFFILDGIRRSIVFPTEIIVGTFASALLAGILDVGFLGLERLLTPWRREGSP